MYKKIILALMLICLVGCGKVRVEEKIAVFSWGEPIPTTYQTVYQSVDFIFEEGKPAGLVEEQVQNVKAVFVDKEIWLLAGDPTWTGTEMQTAARLAKEAGFKGLVLDCEVWVDGVSKEQREASVAGIKETADKTDIPVLVCTPYWNEDNEKLAKVADGLVIMMYLVGQEDLAEPVIKMCEKEGKSVVMALELQPTNGDVSVYNTYNGDVEAAIKAWEPYKDRAGLALHYLQVLK